MSHRVIVDVAALGDLAQQLRAVRGALSALDDLDIDAAALGDETVGDATREVQHGWHANRAGVENRIDTLSAFVDAAAQAADAADGGIVTGRSR